MNKSTVPIAALAEALHATLGSVLPSETEADWDLTAAAILAALPPDWCGHDPTLHIQVADLTERLEDAEANWQRTVKSLGQAEAEIARYRKIEEAARAYLDAVDADMARPGTPADAERRDDTLDALRAALEAER